MTKKIFAICILALLMFAACVPHDDEAGSISPESPTELPNIADILCEREQLLAMGWSEEMIDSLADSGITMENVINQARFSEFAQQIYNNQPIGASGEVLAQQYNGGIYFNDQGILTVMVLDAAFAHEPSATAIEEMQALGIIVRLARFTHQALLDASDALFEVWESAREAGLSSSGIGAENRVTAWLDPYNDEQKAIFTEFLRENSLNPAMFILAPAVTDEMRDHRTASVAAAIASPDDQIVLVGKVEVSRTGIIFTLENRTAQEFNYGARFDMAYYSNGEWLPVPHLPGAGGGTWTLQGYMMQGGGIKESRQNWEWWFGQLSPGRYMFIRDGWLGGWSPDQEPVYALVEFFITEDTPVYLPPQADISYWPSVINLVEYSNVTSAGMTIVIDNISPYDIDHRAQIIAIVNENDVRSENHWEWPSLPFLPVDGYWIDYLMQGEGFLPSGGTLEFTLDWTAVFGELPPGEYRIVIDVGGRAHPPHPTGWQFGDMVIIAFSV